MKNLPHGVHQTSTGNYTYKQYTFVPQGAGFLFCGKVYASFKDVMFEINRIIFRNRFNDVALKEEA